MIKKIKLNNVVFDVEIKLPNIDELKRSEDLDIDIEWFRLNYLWYPSERSKKQLETMLDIQLRYNRIKKINKLLKIMK